MTLEAMDVTHDELVMNGVSVQMKLAKDLPLVQGDRVQLLQVMDNLIINVIEAMSPRAAGARDLTQNPPPPVFQNAEHPFYLSSEATPPGLSRENSRPLASGARTALRVRRPNREPVRRQFPPGPMPASRRQCFA